MYGDCQIVHLVISEQLLRHPLQTLAAGLHAKLFFSVISVNKRFRFCRNLILFSKLCIFLDVD